MRVSWIVLALGLMCAFPQNLRAGWIAYNDHGSGPGTAPFATRYHILGYEEGTQGPLRDVVSGESLPVTLTISQTGITPGIASGGVPPAGSSLDNVFNGSVDFSGNPSNNNVGLSFTATVTYTLSGLDPGQVYVLQASAALGANSGSETNIYTLFTLSGADSFTSAHSAGCLVKGQIAIETNQVAINTGRNHLIGQGDLVDWRDVDPGSDGTIAIICRRYNGALPGGGNAGGNGIALTALRVEEPTWEPVAILVQPADTTVMLGEPAAFAVVAAGHPVFYQWYRGDEVIPGATHATLTLPSTEPADDGAEFSVVVSNTLNSLTSDVAVLHLEFPPPEPADVVSWDHPWRYEDSGADHGDLWKEPDYDDSAWPSGPGLFGTGVNNAFLLSPVLTPLAVSTSDGFPVLTHYFRTTFDWSSTNARTWLRLTNHMDDGLIAYLNGREIYRLNMPEGHVTSTTQALRGYGYFVPLSTNLVIDSLIQGTNHLAVELHRFGSIPDTVFGLRLQAASLPQDYLEFLTQPEDRVAFTELDTVQWSLQLIAGSPYESQWTKDEVPLAGETNDVLFIDPVAYVDSGQYRLVVSNEFATRTSQPALLQSVAPESSMLTVIQIANTWSYHAEGLNLGTAWRDPEFKDADWPKGPALLGLKDGTAMPEPILTPLALTNAQGQRVITYYFRTAFTAPASDGPVHLVLKCLIDDGVVFYMNGQEIQRLHMPAGPVSFNTFADVNLNNGTAYERLFLPNAFLSAGLNNLTAEVHQSATNSSDVIFGTQLLLYPAYEWPPQILQHPQSRSVQVGFPATLTPEVFGSPLLRFQWYQDGEPLEGATNRSLHFSTALPEHQGNYHVDVSNDFGWATSTAALLEVVTDAPTPVSLLRGPYLQQVNSSQILVRWRTDLPSQARARYGTNPANLSLLNTSLDYATNHVLLLTNLMPFTRYYYSVGTPATNLAEGSDFHFTTAPLDPKPLRIWVTGDSGTATPEARAVADAYLNFAGTNHTDVWLMLGDNAYPSGTDGQYQTALFDMFPDLLRRTVLWPTLGNHDTYGPNLEGQLDYFDIFSLPTQGEAGGIPSGTENYYSFDYGNAHFVCLDSEISSHATDGTMIPWLRQDLAAQDRDWLIAFWHSPPYTHGSHDSDDPFDSVGHMVSMRENVLPVLEQYGVDLVLCGHSHVYERSYLLHDHYGFSDTLDPAMVLDWGDGNPAGTGAYRKVTDGSSPLEGAVYVVAGNAGQTTFGTLDHPVMHVSLLEMGSLVLDIDGPRLEARFLRDTGIIRDHFVILKGVEPEALRIIAVIPSEASAVLVWKTVAGGQYQVESTSTLLPESWLPLSPWLEAQGATTYWTNDFSEAPLRQFYRVAEAP